MSKAIIKQIQDEDPTFGGNKLFIDLIPRSCWFSSVRAALVKSDWDRVRKFVYQRANNNCQCCQSSENLQAHERWSYDQDSKKQKLMRIIALCKKCHFATHFGRAQCIGLADEAKQHIMKVRNWKEEQFETHKKEAFQIWRQRNKTNWELDISIIKKNGFRLTKKYEQKIKK